MDLRTLIEHARTAAPYYQDRLPPVGIPLPDDVDALLRRLPLLSREDIRRAGHRLQARTEDTASWRRMLTTGTTREPLEVILDAEAQLADAVVLADHIDHCLGQNDWRRGDLLHVVLHPEATSRSLPALWDGGGRVTKWNLSALWRADDDAFLRGLGQLAGQVVTAIPSGAELLARRVHVAGAAGSVRPALVILSGETIEPELRELLNEVFACPVSSLYVLAEAGIIGRECLDGGYHVVASKAVVEIVDEAGERTPVDVEGEVVVTPLTNRAMPLLRYRTGDRACWLEAPCRCGLPGARLSLTTSRRPVRLLTTTGETVEAIRFSKLLSGLAVEQFAFSQTAPGAVTVSYRSPESLGPAAAALVAGCLHAALGPTTTVQLDHVRTGPVRDRVLPAPPGGAAEPAGPKLSEVVDWLRARLPADLPFAAALLTGSALEPDQMTRFSDIDLALVFRSGFDVDRCLALVTSLRRELPRLSVHAPIGPELARCAPLQACRLHSEHVLVRGDLDEALVPWPTAAALRAEGRVWLNGAIATLWQRATEPDAQLRDPIREAYLALKLVVNALRYRYLIRGERATAPWAVLARAEEDSFARTAWFAELRTALAVAREHHPPPLALPTLARRYHCAALSCLRLVADDLSSCSDAIELGLGKAKGAGGVGGAEVDKQIIRLLPKCHDVGAGED